jgi:predicted metal-dependent enzyme (double-stranded beta helix superfamily)
MDKMQQLIKFINHSHDISPSKLSSFLYRLNFSRSDFSDWIGDVETANTREDKELSSGIQKTIVHQAPYYEVLLVRWDQQSFSSVHFHEQVQWGIIQIFGEASYSTFLFDETDMQVNCLTETKLEDKSLVEISPETMHQLGNHAIDPLVTLHVYGNHSPIENISESVGRFKLEKEKLIPIFDKDAF